MIDLDRGWRTERLGLEPLTVAHATELAPLLDDPRLHEFTGGAPVSAAALADRYRRLEKRSSPGGDQGWGNWVMRVRATGRAVGTVQATLPADGPAAGPAEVAWVVAREAQGRGYAKEAARSLVALLQAAGWDWIDWREPSGARATYHAGTMGNSDFAGGYLGMALPYLLLVATAEGRRVRSILAMVLAADPQSYEAKFQLARLLAYSRQREEAIRVYTELLSTRPTNSGYLRCARSCLTSRSETCSCAVHRAWSTPCAGAWTTGCT